MSDEAKEVVAELIPLKASHALTSREAMTDDRARWQALIKSGVLPRHIDSADKAITIARFGEVFGWDPMRSLRAIHLVEGRPELSAESMLSLIREKCPEAIVTPIEVSAKRVTIRVVRPPQVPDPIDTTVTIEQFEKVRTFNRKANREVALTEKDNWRNYPEDMLWARCVSRVGRRFFPDVTAGAYTLGELEESGFSVRQVAGPREAAPLEDEPIDATIDQRPKVEPEDVIEDGPTRTGTLGDGLDQREQGELGFAKPSHPCHPDAEPPAEWTDPEDP